MSQKKESIFLHIISMPPVESNQTEREGKKEENKICYLQYIHKVQGGTSNIMLFNISFPKKN